MALTPTSPKGIKKLKIFATGLLVWRCTQLALGITIVTGAWMCWSANLFRYPNSGEYLTNFLLASIALSTQLHLTIYSFVVWISILRIRKSRPRPRSRTAIALHFVLEAVNLILWLATFILWFETDVPDTIAWDFKPPLMMYWQTYMMLSTYHSVYGMVWAQWTLALSSLVLEVWQTVWARRARHAIVARGEHFGGGAVAEQFDPNVRSFAPALDRAAAGKLASDDADSAVSSAFPSYEQTQGTTDAGRGSGSFGGDAPAEGRVMAPSALRGGGAGQVGRQERFTWGSGTELSAGETLPPYDLGAERMHVVDKKMAV